MLRIIFATLAVCGMVTAGACTNKTESGAEAAVASPAPGANQAPAASGAEALVANSADAQSAQATVPQPKIVVPPKPKPGAPHGPGFDMPLIELGGFAPPRPMDVLKDAHIFTADHPEVASYIPCYCGCGNMGHKNNADCFVGSRDAQGKVTAWVPHGAACAVCIDIAVESMRMRNSGASVSAIRTQIQNEYRSHFPTTETATPPPPANR